MLFRFSNIYHKNDTLKQKHDTLWMHIQIVMDNENWPCDKYSCQAIIVKYTGG